MPTEKQIAATKEDLWMSFSTKGPKKAADIPKKKIARLKAHSTLPFVTLPSKYSTIVSLTRDQQYTVPMLQ